MAKHSLRCEIKTISNYYYRVWLRPHGKAKWTSYFVSYFADRKSNLIQSD